MLHHPFSSLVSLCAICLCFRDHLQASYRCKLFHFAVGWRLPILFSDCSFFLTWWCSQRISSLENTIHSSSYTEAQACVITIWSHFTSWPRNMVPLRSTRQREIDHRLVHRRTPQSSQPLQHPRWVRPCWLFLGWNARFRIRSSQAAGEALDHY